MIYAVEKEYAYLWSCYPYRSLWLLFFPQEKRSCYILTESYTSSMWFVHLKQHLSCCQFINHLGQLD